MIRKVQAAAAVAVLAILTTAGTGFAADEKRNDPLDTKSGARSAVSSADARAKGLTISAAKAPKISAPNVRVALVYDPDIGIVRSKGVNSIRLPSGQRGLYCVRLNSSISGDARFMVPQLTADFSPGPAGNSLFAYWRSGTCNSAEIGVQTTRSSGGSPVTTDLVGFSLIAP